MQILKFGGSSVANPDRIRACGRVLAQKRQQDGYRAMVVCSALGGITDALGNAGRLAQSGDGGYIDEDGYLFVMGRTDDVINVAGHRLSTGEMEEIVAAHPAVAECAVIGVQDQLKGQMPIGLVILKDGADIDPETLQKELVANVRATIGAIACFQTAHVVNRLPKTRSGKILRAILRKIADGQDYVVPSTIEDMGALDDAKALFGRSA